MADRSYLVPTPITDVTGKQTTVYRRPAASHSARTMPAPSVAPLEPIPSDASDEDYAERLADIEERNDMWRRRLHADMESIAMDALTHVGDLAIAAGNAGTREGRMLGTAMKDAISEEKYTQILIAEAMWPVADQLWRHRMMFKELPDARQRAKYSQLRAGEPEARHLEAVMAVANRLQEADLLALDAVPDHSDDRFAAHLWLHLRGDVDYSIPDEEVIDLIRLTDEHPTRAGDIHRGIVGDMHEAAIRELLTGGTPSLADGAL